MSRQGVAAYQNFRYCREIETVPPVGIEPTTFGLKVRCSAS